MLEAQGESSAPTQHMVGADNGRDDGMAEVVENRDPHYQTNESR